MGLCAHPHWISLLHLQAMETASDFGFSLHFTVTSTTLGSPANVTIMLFVSSLKFFMA